MGPSKKKRIGDILLENKVIDRHQLKAALTSQQRWGRRLGETLVSLGFITEEKLIQTLSQHLQMPSVNLRKVQPDARALALLPRDFCQTHGVVPVKIEKIGAREYLVLAVSDPTNLDVLDEVQFLTKLPAKSVLAGFTSIAGFIRKNLLGEDFEGVTLSRITVDEGPVIVRGGNEELVEFEEHVDEETQGRIKTTQTPFEKRFILLLKVLYKKNLISRSDVEKILKENF